MLNAARPLGSSGLNVRPIGLGGMPLSLARRPLERDAIAVIHAAIDAGMDFIDTADVYCRDHTDIGHNERLIAKALRDRPSTRVVVATKGGLERPDGRWTRNGHPDHLRRACEASLRALGVETIELYQLHAPDPDVRFNDTVGTLADLQKAGKIQHVGLSNVTVQHIRAARAIVPIVSVQNRCNPYDRTAWKDGVLAYCQAEGIAFLPYSPVGGSRDRDRLAANPILTAIGARHSASPFQVALAWLVAASPVTIPIPGASRVSSAVSSAAAMKLRLTETDRAELARAFPT